MLRRICIIVIGLMLALPTPTLADTSTETPKTLPVIITEIYANAPGTSELGNEYIELHNSTNEPINLAGYTLSRAGNSTTQQLDNITLIAGEYLAIITQFSLLNSGGTVYLHYPPTELEEVIVQVDYLSLDELHSWSLVGDIWLESDPTPSEENPMIIEEEIVTPVEEDNEQEPIVEVEPLCQVSTVFINEIVANPRGSDTNGGEYIELYNAGDTAVSLEGCILTTDKLPKLILENIKLEPGAYFAVTLENKLLNGGGSVSLITNTNESTVEYPSLGDDQSWSIIDGEWRTSTIMTPGTKNQSTPPEPLSSTKDSSSTSCPKGKYRNPETNRCKSIVETASSLLPCDPGSARNPETNRCRRLTTASTTLKACEPGQERNPETNRCRKIQAISKSLADCKEGEERNPNTNRCRKTGSVLSGATIDTPTKEAGIHSGVFLVMTLAALGYGVYEYRLDFNNLIKKIHLTRTKRT